MRDDPLLQAILDSPDDDGLRLVYADFLEEHGEPERAELIRVQIELSRLPEGDPRQAALETREAMLLKQHEQTWTEPLRALLGEMLDWPQFRRGFIEELTVRGRLAGLKAPDFPPYATGMFRLAPLRHLTLGLDYPYPTPPLRGEELVRYVLKPLAGLMTLALPGHGLQDEAAEALAASPHVAGLTGLDLARNRIGDAGVQALAASPNLAGLTFLGLRGNAIGDAGAVALAQSAVLSGLEYLSMERNPLGPLGRDALRARFGNDVNLGEEDE
jgi:uncharacterized protein (TIGR02996 family)